MQVLYMVNYWQIPTANSFDKINFDNQTHTSTYANILHTAIQGKYKTLSKYNNVVNNY